VSVSLERVRDDFGYRWLDRSEIGRLPGVRRAARRDQRGRGEDQRGGPWHVQASSGGSPSEARRTAEAATLDDGVHSSTTAFITVRLLAGNVQT
jgi:hypothetical protein